MMELTPSLYEAAEVDGATSSQIFRKITLPPFLSNPDLCYDHIPDRQHADVRCTSDPDKWNRRDPMRSTMTLIMFLNKHLFSKNYGMGGRSSVFLFIITGMLSLIVFRFNKIKD